MQIPPTDSTLVDTSLATAYDTTWSAQLPASPPSSGMEALMLSHDKIYVVLAVVLIIWFGLLFLLVRNDRKLDELERRTGDDRSSTP